MCQVPKDREVYIDLLQTAIQCLEGGNLYVQNEFLALFRVRYRPCLRAPRPGIPTSTHHNSVHPTCCRSTAPRCPTLAWRS